MKKQESSADNHKTKSDMTSVFDPENPELQNTTMQVQLQKTLLEKVDNLRLDLMKLMPYHSRPLLEEEKFIEIILNSVVDDYNEGKGKSQIIEELKNVIAEIPKQAE